MNNQQRIDLDDFVKKVLLVMDQENMLSMKKIPLMQLFYDLLSEPFFIFI